MNDGYGVVSCRCIGADGDGTLGYLDPVRELPYRLAAHIAASEAGQMAASDHVPIMGMRASAPDGRRPCIVAGALALNVRNRGFSCRSDFGACLPLVHELVWEQHGPHLSNRFAARMIAMVAMVANRRMP